jgi:DNA-binding LacI/PurR family transcriptional regulator
MEALMNAAPRPDAIIFANDNLAAGGLLAGQRAGLRSPKTALYSASVITRSPRCCCRA